MRGYGARRTVSSDELSFWMSTASPRSVAYRPVPPVTASRIVTGDAGSSPWTRRNFARWLFEDYPRAILVTPRRWHRHFLGRPGAYLRSSACGPD